MISYTSCEYITTVNYTTTDRHCNLFWKISVLFICLSGLLLWGWKTVLCYLYVTLQFSFNFTCFFLDLQLQAHKIAWARRDKNQKIKPQNKQLPYLCLILKYLSLIIMQKKGDKCLPWINFLFSFLANICSSGRFYSTVSHKIQWTKWLGYHCSSKFRVFS